MGRQPRGSRNPFANQETYGVPDIGTTPADYIKSLPDGAIVDRNLMHHTGYTGKQLDAMAVLARNEDIVTGTRLTNMDSMRHVRDKTGLPKPLTVKSKTIGELDTYLGASANDKGLVGLFDPGAKPPTRANNGIPKHVWDKLNDAKKDNLMADLRKRWSERKGEFDGRSKMLANKDIGWDEARGVVVSESTGTPFAGDIDPVFFRDAKTGKYLSSDRYLEIVETFKASAAQGQHGAEVNLMGDLTRHHKLGSPEWHQAYDKALELQGDLGRSHTVGTELVVEMGPDGILRRGTHMGGGLPDVEGVKDAAARLGKLQK